MSGMNGLNFPYEQILHRRFRYAIGAKWDKLKPGGQSGKYFSLVRTHPDKPSPTVCGSHGNPSTVGITHPTEKRKFTIAELKRICAFPDDFILTGP